MRIKNLKIDSFGKLNSVNIALDDKITVIHGKNEAGKSTVSTFIKYMLYGFEASKKQEVAENQKKKFMPWNDDECAGELDFSSADGKSYTALRKTASRTQNTVFDENGMPLTGDNAGDYFLGVNENVYKKTAFIGQSDTVFTDDGELDGAIKNMVYSADESVDSQKAIKKLEDLRKYYLGKTGKTGKLFEIEKELSTLVEEREKWKDGHKELLSAENKLESTLSKIAHKKLEKEKLLKEKQNLECYEAKKKLLQIEEAKKKAEQSKSAFEEHYKLMQNGLFVPNDEYAKSLVKVMSDIDGQNRRIDECSARLNKAKENLDGVYGDEKQKNISNALERENKTASGLLKQLSLIKQRAKKAKITAIILTCFIVTIPIAIFFYIKCSKASKELLDLAHKYGVNDVETLEKKLSGDESFKNIEESAKRYYNEASQSLADAQNELSRLTQALSLLCEKAGIDISQAGEYLEKLQSWLLKNEELKNICKLDFVAYDTLMSSCDLQTLSEKASGFDDTVEIRDMKTVSQNLLFFTQSLDALIPRQMELEKKAAVLSNTLPKPAEIQSRILSLSEQQKEMREKHSALCLAIETLERASENMRSEASPKIAAETSKLFCEITGGKYKGLYADGEMKLTFLEEDEAQVRDAGYLSTGTLDAAYISLRIALCEFLYKEHPTLIFDDAFSRMDDERLAKTLDFLVQLSQQFQIVILSCHDREKNYLADKAKIIDFEV